MLPDLEKETWVYWLDRKSHAPDDRNSFRVSFVFENRSGHYPNGGKDVLPWYWNEETCAKKNYERGFPPDLVVKIVESSMFAKH